MKTCFKCLVAQPIDNFYRHPQMGDGHLGKCKDCTKRDVAANRAANQDYYNAYENERNKLPHRRQARQAYLKRWRTSDKRRQRAHNAAIRRHRVAPSVCQMCREQKRLERHHPDYDMPTLIVWLCKRCHVIADRIRREKEPTT